MAKRRLSYEKKKSAYGYIFISLWLIGFVALFLVPFINAIIYSFNELDIEPGQLHMTYVGWENYLRAFTQDADFLPVFTGTLTAAVVQTPVTVLFSLFVAILLNANFRGQGIARAIFFLPVVIMSGPVVAVMNYDVFFNTLVSGDRASAMLTITSTQDILQTLGVNPLIADYIVNITNQLFNLSWSSGIQILIFIAGLQGIPTTYYEVAQIEGATGWEIFWKVTLPSIGPMILVNVFYTLYDGLLTGGEMFGKISHHLGNLEFAYASALSLMCFIVWGLLIAIVYKIVSSWVSVK
ncbi:MAG: sugar ABC transporter permease [Clostridia bacterium]|nr:sugar ABC transporter permease [Clostridia bacterium]